MNEHEVTTSPADGGATRANAGDHASVLDLELQALAYEAALRYGARQVPKPLVEFLRPQG